MLVEVAPGQRREGVSPRDGPRTVSKSLSLTDLDDRRDDTKDTRCSGCQSVPGASDGAREDLWGLGADGDRGRSGQRKIKSVASSSMEQGAHIAVQHSIERILKEAGNAVEGRNLRAVLCACEGEEEDACECGWSE